MKKALLPLAIAALATQVHAGTVITDGADIKISTKGGLKAATTDNKASVQLGGRLQWDYDSTEADDRNIDTQDADVRRARIFLKGHYGDWAYKMQFNVAESSGAKGGDAEDLYLRYTGFGKQANITIGKQKEPFGLEEQTSSKDISLLERSAMTEAYAPGRNAGIQLHGKGSNWTYGIGYFEADGDGSNDFDNKAVTGRVTFAPVKSDDLVVHLGAGFSSRDADSSDDERDVYNVELATAAGPFHAQAEYFDVDEGNLDEDGYYVQLGWILTGESRPYKDGKFKRVKPSTEAGAWEVVLRYEDGYGKFSDAGLRTLEGEQTSFGVNYYMNSNVRLGVSYMDAEEDASGFDGDEFRARVQFAF